MFLKADDLLLLFLPKKNVLVWVWGFLLILLLQTGLQKTIFSGFIKFFHNYLIQTEVANIN